MPSIGLSEPPAPGVRFWVYVRPGCTALGTMPPPHGQGFTTDFNGDRWRAVLQSATGDLDSGWTLEFEIKGPLRRRTDG